MEISDGKELQEERVKEQVKVILEGRERVQVIQGGRERVQVRTVGEENNFKTDLNDLEEVREWVKEKSFRVKAILDGRKECVKVEEEQNVLEEVNVKLTTRRDLRLGRGCGERKKGVWGWRRGCECREGL